MFVALLLLLLMMMMVMMMRSSDGAPATLKEVSQSDVIHCTTLELIQSSAKAKSVLILAADRHGGPETDRKIDRQTDR